MKAAKEIALVGVFTALLIGGQFVLSGISGVEIVTVLLLSFSYCFGIRMGYARGQCVHAFAVFRIRLFP